MKNVIASFFFFATAFCLSNTAQAQKTATWQGGAAGKAMEWTCAANWKEGRVPGEFSDVIIPDVSSTGGFQPVIRTASEAVNSLTLLPGATLDIDSKGSIEVFETLNTIATGNIHNHGRLTAPLMDPGAMAVSGK